MWSARACFASSFKDLRFPITSSWSKQPSITSRSMRRKTYLEHRRRTVYVLLQSGLHAHYLVENFLQRHQLGLCLEHRFRHLVDDLGYRCRGVADTSFSSHSRVNSSRIWGPQKWNYLDCEVMTYRSHGEGGIMKVWTKSCWKLKTLSRTRFQ